MDYRSAYLVIHLVGISPGIQCLTSKLWPVIQHDPRWCTVQHTLSANEVYFLVSIHCELFYGGDSSLVKWVTRISASTKTTDQEVIPSWMVAVLVTLAYPFSLCNHLI